MNFVYVFQLRAVSVLMAQRIKAEINLYRAYWVFYREWNGQKQRVERRAMYTKHDHVLIGMNELSIFQMNGSVAPMPASVEAVPFEHRLFTKPQMADYFAVEVRTVESWMREGILPYIKIGRNVRFQGADIIATLNDLRHAARRHGRTEPV